MTETGDVCDLCCRGKGSLLGNRCGTVLFAASDTGHTLIVFGCFHLFQPTFPSMQGQIRRDSHILIAAGKTHMPGKIGLDVLFNKLNSF